MQQMARSKVRDDGPGLVVFEEICVMPRHGGRLRQHGIGSYRVNLVPAPVQKLRGLSANESSCSGYQHTLHAG